MTDQEINIAIAEACGWKHIYNDKLLQAEWISPAGYSTWAHELPDYCNDLNAMHEAEKTIKLPSDRQKYSLTLHKICGESWLEVPFATVRQRAEAFLRTIGKRKGPRSQAQRQARRPLRGAH